MRVGQHKETGSRYERLLQDADSTMEKVRPSPWNPKALLAGSRSSLFLADPSDTPRPPDPARAQAKGRFDTTVEELERILILKEGGSLKDSGMQLSPGGSANGSSDSGGGGGRKKLGKAIGKGAGLTRKGEDEQMQRQEDEVRQRMSQASDTFRKSVLDAQSVRQEYFNTQLPKILRVRPPLSTLPLLPSPP